MTSRFAGAEDCNEPFFLPQLVSTVLQGWQARAKSIAHSWDNAKVARSRLYKRGSLRSNGDKLGSIFLIACCLQVLLRGDSVTKAEQALEASCERADPLDLRRTR